MALRVGFHVEGHDWLILRALLASILQVAEQDLAAERLDLLPLGWQEVLEGIERALHKFYAMCAQLAVIGIDNDGNEDLQRSGRTEDARRPRHWNHAPNTHSDCRHCQIQALAARIRPRLNWLPQKPGQTWPILVTVPVEMIETWLLIIRSVQVPGFGWHHAERMPRQSQKMAMYGRPEATQEDVESIALPYVRSLTAAALQSAMQHSRSLTLFVNDVQAIQRQILGPRDCWQAGDGAAEA
jgi:hypothetical protein